MKNRLVDHEVARAILAQCFTDAVAWLGRADVNHNHPTRVELEPGEGCLACDLYHDIQTLKYMKGKYCEDS